MFTGGLTAIPALLVTAGGSSVVAFGAGQAASYISGTTIDKLCQAIYEEREKMHAKSMQKNSGQNIEELGEVLHEGDNL